MAEQKTKKYNNPVSAIITGVADLFRKQVPSGVLLPDHRMDGKTVLVDGSSSGLGLAIATDIAKRGARVIMACRSGIPEKGEEVKKRSGNSDVHMVPVDFSDTGSIHQLVDTIHDRFGAIDILICNAGIVPKKSRKTRQGLEEMFMVNYFSKFLFVNLLIENNCFSFQNTLKTIPNTPSNTDRASNIQLPASRIIFVASESHRNPEQFEWEEFGHYRDYGIGKSMELYGYYKLLLTTFSVELSRRLNPNGSPRCSVFSMCPGPVNSNIAREAPKVFHPLLKLIFGIFFKSPEKAAVPVVYLAASPDQEGLLFDYFFLMSRKEVDQKASDPENGKMIWAKSEELRKKLEQ